MIKDITDVAGHITKLRQLTAEKADIEEQIAYHRVKIEDALDDADTGEIDGQPVIRWAHITTRRFDQTLAKARIPAEMLSQCYTETITRPFRLLT